MLKFLTFVAAIFMLAVTFVTDAFAGGRRCGDYIDRSGRIVMGPDCDRHHGWKHRHGQRQWAPTRPQRAYYTSRSQVQRQVVVRQSMQTYSRAQRTGQVSMQPSVNCKAMGGVRTINPNTGRPSCFVR